MSDSVEVESLPVTNTNESNNNTNNVSVNDTDENTNTNNVKSPGSTKSAKTLVSPLSASLTPKFKLDLPISLNIKNLFEQPKPKIDKNKKPKNIEKLDALAKPLHTNKKFVHQLAEEQEAAKQQQKPTELPEPKNMEWIKRMSEPLVKVEKFNPEEEERKLKDAAKNTGVRELPPPKNKDVLERLANPLARNISKKFSAILDEEKELEQKQKTLKKKQSSMKSQSAVKSTNKSTDSVNASTDDIQADSSDNITEPTVDTMAQQTVKIKLNDQATDSTE